MTPEGRVTFIGHDVDGAEIAAAVLDPPAGERSAARARGGAHPPPPAARLPRPRDADRPAGDLPLPARLRAGAGRRDAAQRRRPAGHARTGVRRGDRAPPGARARVAGGGARVARGSPAPTGARRRAGARGGSPTRPAARPDPRGARGGELRGGDQLARAGDRPSAGDRRRARARPSPGDSLGGCERTRLHLLQDRRRRVAGADRRRGRTDGCVHGHQPRDARPPAGRSAAACAGPDGDRPGGPGGDDVRGPADGAQGGRAARCRRREPAQLLRGGRLADRIPLPRARDPALRGRSAAVALDPRAGRSRRDRGGRRRRLR